VLLCTAAAKSNSRRLQVRITEVMMHAKDRIISDTRRCRAIQLVMHRFRTRRLGTPPLIHSLERTQRHVRLSDIQHTRTALTSAAPNAPNTPKLTCSVWFSNTLLQCSELAAKTELMLIAMWFHVISGVAEQSHVNFNSKSKSNSNQKQIVLGF